MLHDATHAVVCFLLDGVYDAGGGVRDVMDICKHIWTCYGVFLLFPVDVAVDRGRVARSAVGDCRAVAAVHYPCL